MNIINKIKNFFKKENELLKIDKEDLIFELKRLSKNKIVQEIIWDMKRIYEDKKVLRDSKRELKKLSKNDLLKIMIIIKQKNKISENLIH